VLQKRNNSILFHKKHVFRVRVARWFAFIPKIQIWVNFGGLALEDVGIYHGHVVHFTVFCYILWAFGRVRGDFVFFSRFGILYQEKSGSHA
jgi:hypothetical protein